MTIRFLLDGAPVEVDAGPAESLLSVLRDHLGVRSARESCGIGACGACTVLVDGELISSCILLAPLAEGASITTAAGIPPGHPIREAIARAHAYQCGFCTPGVAITAFKLLEESPQPSGEEIRDALAANLCRCGSYLKIVEAVEGAAGQPTADRP